MKTTGVVRHCQGRSRLRCDTTRHVQLATFVPTFPRLLIKRLSYKRGSGSLAVGAPLIADHYLAQLRSLRFFR